MRRFTHITYLAGLAIAILVGGLLAGKAAQAEEFTFVAQELGKRTAIWLPSLVVIEAAMDLEGGLVFIVENPTNKEHAFAVHGLFEMVEAEEDKAIVESDPATYLLKPLRFKIDPQGTKRVRVGTEMLEGRRSAGQRFKFFCPIHSRRTHINGAIWVVG